MHRKFIIGLLVMFFIQAQAQELLNYPLDTVNGEEVYVYQVERSIGLYRVSVNFGVPASEIVRMNPQLQNRGLHFGETLLIPTKRQVIIESRPKVVQTTVTETTVQPALTETREQPAVAEVEPVIVEKPQEKIMENQNVAPIPGNVIELALMLPFESRQTKRSLNGDRMMELYQGALLALHELQDGNTRYRLRVYDTERSERRVNELCESTELDSIQGIVGLAYPIQVERMVNWSEAHNIPLLLPFSDDVDLNNRPHVLQFNSTDKQEADSLCGWIGLHNTHCVAIEVNEADLAPTIRSLRRQMTAHGIPYTALALRDLLADSAAYALDIAKENIIILHSDKYQHVRILLPHLAKLQEDGYSIRIISQYSWQKENIALPQLYTSMFNTPKDQATYTALWNTYFSPEHTSETPRYDLLGYDLIRAMVAWLQGTKETNGLQSDIRWMQTSENGGYQNAKVTVMITE